MSEFRRKPETIEAIQVQVAGNIVAGGKELAFSAGDWLVFLGGEPVEVLSDGQFKARYEPVKPKTKTETKVVERIIERDRSYPYIPRRFLDVARGATAWGAEPEAEILPPVARLAAS